MTRPLSKVTWPIVFVLSVAFVASLLSFSDITRGSGHFFFDQLSKTLPKSAPQDIVLIVIDEQSLSKLGRWPWSRHIHAKMFKKLQQSKLRALGVNLIFADSESTAADQALLNAIQENERLVLPLTSQIGSGHETLQIGTTIGDLDKLARQRGHTDIGLENGVARSVFLRAGIGKPNWPSLALAMWEVGGKPVPQPLPGMRYDTDSTPQANNWVRDHQILIPFVGPPGQFDRISYTDVLNQNFDIRMLDNKMVLLGVEATGIGDRFATPVSDNTRLMSGIELQANILSAFYNQQLIHPLQKKIGLAITLVLLLPIIAYFTLSLFWTTLLVFTQAAAALLLSLFLLHEHSLWFDPSILLLLLLISYPVCISRTLKNVMSQLFQVRQHSSVVLNAIGDAVITIDSNNRISYMNKQAEAMVARPINDCRGELFSSIFIPAKTHRPNAIFEAIQKCRDRKELVHTRGPSAIENISGKQILVTATAGPILDHINNVTDIVIGVTDVTENIKASEQLAFQATHDPLTNLPNRNLLLDRLNVAILRAARSQQMIAVIFIDLDQFKHVNDAFGHAVGDQLLKAVAEKFTACAREGDTIARLGGDEFVLLLEELSNANIAASVAYKILELANYPYTIDEHKLLVSCSVGISVYPKDGVTAADLLKHADTAMYQVKSSGRNDLRYFSHEMSTQTLRRLHIEKGLHNALRNNELRLHYQPQFSIRDNSVIGVEALIRWRHQNRDDIPPAEFIPVAEDIGIIFSIGDWVLRSACQQFMQWRQRELKPCKLSVNISPRQMLNKEFIHIIDNALTSNNMPAEFLELEITEHSIMTDLQHAATILQEFKSIGCSIAVDDFGTGYSSLSYLKHLPIDTLKIDQSFVTDIATREEDRAITQAIITMAKGLNMQVVAEGVETPEQLNTLQEQQCDGVQGYLTSPPLEAGSMGDFLTASCETSGLSKGSQ